MKKKTVKKQTKPPGARRPSANMAFLARLAPGLIHEINNPVAVISAAAQLLGRAADKGSLSSNLSREDLSLILGKISKSADNVIGVS